MIQDFICVGFIALFLTIQFKDLDYGISVRRRNKVFLVPIEF